MILDIATLRTALDGLQKLANDEGLIADKVQILPEQDGRIGLISRVLAPDGSRRSCGIFVEDNTPPDWWAA